VSVPTNRTLSAFGGERRIKEGTGGPIGCEKEKCKAKVDIARGEKRGRVWVCTVPELGRGEGEKRKILTEKPSSECMRLNLKKG